jgi:hypothetical protein
VQRVPPAERGAFPAYWPFRREQVDAQSTARPRQLVADKFGSPRRIRTRNPLVDAGTLGQTSSTAYSLESGRVYRAKHSSARFMPALNIRSFQLLSAPGARADSKPTALSRSRAFQKQGHHNASGHVAGGASQLFDVSIGNRRCMEYLDCDRKACVLCNGEVS